MAMWQALGTLPHRQRVVLVLRAYEGLADSEIAEILGAAEGTVRSLAARAYATLRQHPTLREYGRSPDRFATTGADRRQIRHQIVDHTSTHQEDS